MKLNLMMRQLTWLLLVPLYLPLLHFNNIIGVQTLQWVSSGSHQTTSHNQDRMRMARIGATRTPSMSLQSEKKDPLHFHSFSESKNIDHIHDSHSISRNTFLTSSFLSCCLLLSSSNTQQNRCNALEIQNKTTTTSLTITIDSNAKANNEKTWEETISGFVSGAALSFAKTVVKYPLDTATVRLQLPNTPYSIMEPIPLFQGSFNGIVAPLLGNIPAGAIFFAVKDATKAYLTSSSSSSSTKYLPLNPFWATCIAVGVAQFPHWIVRNPSEVIKTRQQAKNVGDDMDSTLRAIVSKPTRWEHVQELYKGYWENVIYGYPADVIKFGLYEAFTSSHRFAENQRRNDKSDRTVNNHSKVYPKKKLTPWDAAVYGAVSTAISQWATTPLDVVRNRIMVTNATDLHNTNTTSRACSNDATKRDGNTNHDTGSYMNKLRTLAREEGLKGLFAGASPRIGKAILSGAIQFATYEETQVSIRKLLEQKATR